MTRANWDSFAKRLADTKLSVLTLLRRISALKMALLRMRPKEAWVAHSEVLNPLASLASPRGPQQQRVLAISSLWRSGKGA